MHTRARRTRVGGQLQRRRAAHQRIGRIDRYIGDALNASGGGRWTDGDARAVVEHGGERAGVGHHAASHVLRRLGIEPGEFQHRAQHAQHLPARSGVAQRRHDTLKLLQAAFAVDERTRGLGERRHRQQHIGIALAMREGTHHHDQIGLLHCRAGGARTGEIELGFRVQQHVGAARIVKHCLHVHAAALRQRARDVRANRIGSLGEETHRGAGDGCEGLRQRVQGGGVGVLHGIVAEQDGWRLAGCQAGRDGGVLRRGFHAAQCVRDGLAGSTCRGDDHACQCQRQLRRWHDDLVRQAHQPIVGHRVQHRHLRALFRGLTQPLRKQRLVLAQETADHQHAVVRADRCDGHAEPGHACRMTVAAEIALAQPEIDVVAAKAAHQPPGQRQFLERGVRRDQRADGAGTMLADDVRQTMRDELKRRGPVDRLPFAPLLDHRRREPFLGIEALVGKTVLVRDPAFVDGFVLERQHAHHAVAFHLHDEVAAEAIVRRHRLPP